MDYDPPAGFIAILSAIEFGNMLQWCASNNFDVTELNSGPLNILVVFEIADFDEICEEIVHGNRVNGIFSIYPRV